MSLFEKKPQTIIQNQINEKLSYINGKYVEIGRYVKLHLADTITDPTIQNLIEEINRTLVELKDLNEKLNALNGIKHCSSCGSTIPINCTFCPSCGARQQQPVVQQNVQPQHQPTVAPVQQPVVQPQQPTPAVQSNDGIIPENNSENTHEEFAQNSQQTEPAAETANNNTPVENTAQNNNNPVPEQQPAGDYIFCSQCGSKEPSDMLFCSQCGNSLK